MGVSGIGQNYYQNYVTEKKNVNNRKTAETDNFTEEVQKAEESRSAQTKSNSSVWAGGHGCSTTAELQRFCL